jgi:hypothetical protein
LTAAISGIQSTLETSNKTLFQTQPRAFFGPTSHKNSNPNTVLAAGKSYRFDVSLQNSGNDVGSNTVVFAHTYTGDPHDMSTNDEIVRKFESDWKDAVKSGIPAKVWRVGTIEQGSPFFVSFDSETLSKQDIDNLAAGKWTIYTVTRISYTDATGSWYSDTCGFLQLPFNKNSATPEHKCQFLGNPRYRPKER